MTKRRSRDRAGNESRVGTATVEEGKVEFVSTDVLEVERSDISPAPAPVPVPVPEIAIACP